jgi:hypothetical protein
MDQEQTGSRRARRPTTSLLLSLTVSSAEA